MKLDATSVVSGQGIFFLSSLFFSVFSLSNYTTEGDLVWCSSNTSVSRANLSLQQSVSKLRVRYLEWAAASGWNLVMQVVCGHNRVSGAGEG